MAAFVETLPTVNYVNKNEAENQETYVSLLIQKKYGRWKERRANKSIINMLTLRA